jgi:hypothetical protein
MEKWYSIFFLNIPKIPSATALSLVTDGYISFNLVKLANLISSVSKVSLGSKI